MRSDVGAEGKVNALLADTVSTQTTLQSSEPHQGHVLRWDASFELNRKTPRSTSNASSTQPPLEYTATTTTTSSSPTTTTTGAIEVITRSVVSAESEARSLLATTEPLRSSHPRSMNALACCSATISPHTLPSSSRCARRGSVSQSRRKVGKSMCRDSGVYGASMDRQTDRQTRHALAQPDRQASVEASRTDREALSYVRVPRSEARLFNQPIPELLSARYAIHLSALL